MEHPARDHCRRRKSTIILFLSQGFYNGLFDRLMPTENSRQSARDTSARQKWMSLLAAAASVWQPGRSATLSSWTARTNSIHQDSASLLQQTLRGNAFGWVSSDSPHPLLDESTAPNSDRLSRATYRRLAAARPRRSRCHREVVWRLARCRR